LARLSAGKSIAANIAMIAITTSSSISVNPEQQPAWLRRGKARCAGSLVGLILGNLFRFPPAEN
jgi:hypothetical protein